VIRQAISCDICGTEMLNVNHWFVAREQGTELRISAWSAAGRQRGKTLHLCGHKCMHKLVDEFITRAIRTDATATPDQPAIRPDAILSSPKATPPLARPAIGSSVQDREASARLTTPEPIERPRSSPYRVRAEAWKREQERQRANLPDSRRSIA